MAGRQWVSPAQLRLNIGICLIKSHSVPLNSRLSFSPGVSQQVTSLVDVDEISSRMSHRADEVFWKVNSSCAVGV